MKYVYAVCYNTLNVFKNKDLAKKFFIECACGSEGAEQERYNNILVDFMFCDIGLDNVSNEINEIVLHDDNNNVLEKIKTNWQNYESAIKEIENE